MNWSRWRSPSRVFRPVKSYYYWPLGAALALVALSALAGLFERLRVRRAAEVPVSAG